MICNWTSTTRTGSMFLLATFLLSTFLFSLNSSCVSVNIGSEKAEKSTAVTFERPIGLFVPFENKGADVAWKNPKTGSTIAYQSACGDSADLTLDAIANDLVSSFEDHQELSRERKPFDSRESLETKIEDRVDGVKTFARALIYKKNRCSYVLTYIYLSNMIGKEDEAQFERFTSSFRAP